MTQRVSLVKAESPGSPEIPLNVDSSGNIGVNVESGGSGGGSGGVVQVSDGTTKTQLLAVDANGKIGVNALPSITGATTNAVLTAVEDQTTHYLATKDVGKVPITGTLQNAATGTGVGTPLTITGMKVVSFQVVSAAGTTSFTIDFEASVDGTNFVPSVVVTDDTDATQANITSVSGTASYNHIFTYICAGKAKVQANISAITPGTGSVTVKAIAVA